MLFSFTFTISLAVPSSKNGSVIQLYEAWIDNRFKKPYNKAIPNKGVDLGGSGKNGKAYQTAANTNGDNTKRACRKNKCKR